MKVTAAINRVLNSVTKTQNTHTHTLCQLDVRPRDVCAGGRAIRPQPLRIGLKHVKIFKFLERPISRCVSCCPCKISVVLSCHDRINTAIDLVAHTPFLRSMCVALILNSPEMWHIWNGLIDADTINLWVKCTRIYFARSMRIMKS